MHRTSLTAVRFCRLDTVDEDEDDGLQRFYQLTRPESLMVYELISREGTPNNNPVPAPNPDPDSDPSSTQSYSQHQSNLPILLLITNQTYPNIT